MKNARKSLLMAALLATAAGLPGLAAAQGTWNLSTDACDPYGGTPGAAGCQVGSVTATVTAWGNTGSGGKYLAANITDQGGSGVGVSSVAANGTVETTANNQHAFDNAATSVTNAGVTTTTSGNNEVALLSFSKAVNLTSLAIGWVFSDADVSILRWTGASGPDLTTMTTEGTGGLVAKGWSLVASGDTDIAGNVLNSGTSAYSSWWLISTYFGASGGTLEAGDDYFKLLSFTTGNAACAGTGTTSAGACATAGRLPEPASLALVGVALLGVAGTARRRRATQTAVAAA